MRVVVDTNVLVRAAAIRNSPAAVLVRQLQAAPEHQLILSPFLISECRDVLSRPYFRNVCGVTPEEADQFCEAISAVATVVNPSSSLSIVKADPKDDPILATALAANADALCTWDRHFYDPVVMAFCAEYGVLCGVWHSSHEGRRASG